MESFVPRPGISPLRSFTNTKFPTLFTKGDSKKDDRSVHDESNDSKVGDKVKIMATRPLSKLKLEVLEIVEKAPVL